LSVLTISTIIPATVYGDIDACSALFSGSSITPGTQSNLNIQVNNESNNPINWIRVVRPNNNFVISGASSEDWAANFADDAAVFSGSSLDPSTAYNRLYLSVDAAANETPPATWLIQVSDDPGGNNPFTCANGGLDLAISDGAAPTFSDIIVENVDTRSAIITWTSDQPSNGQVFYGKTSQYGSASALSSTYTTSHTATLSGLTPNSAYHFKIAGTDAADSSSTSGDNTFVTLYEPPGSVATTPQVINNNSGGGSLSNFGIALKTTPTEKVVPTIATKTDFTKPFKVAPLVTGTAQDNESVAIIEYSMNDGKDWLPVDAAPGIGGKSVSYSFTPMGLEDGNYNLLVRAIDTSANVGTTTAVTMIIDRLDPLVGGIVVSQGPQVISPASDGTISAMAGVSQRITVSAVGGPTKITLVAAQTDGQPGGGTTGKNAQPQSFYLTKSSDTGLWMGDVNFSSAGRYDIVATAVDGAGNRTARVLSAAQVASPAQTIDERTMAGVISKVTLYYQEPASKTWVIWDAAGYSQSNPQVTDSNGYFKYFLPAGKYYIRSEAKNYKTLISSIFQIKQSQAFSSTLTLKPLHKIGVGKASVSFPLLAAQNMTLQNGQQNQNNQSTKVRDAVIDKTAPDFTLKDTNNATVYTADLLGRPTLISIASTWMPAASEQLGTLDELQRNKDINIIPVALQENINKTRAYTAIAGLDLRWLADPDSTLTTKYDISNLPMHYFLDRKGVVRQIETGVVTKQRIIDILSSY
jgi:peroxiredoxin